MTNIIQKAQALGNALAESEEATILHAAETNMDQDHEAQALIKEYQEKHKQLRDVEKANGEASEEEREVLTQIQDKMKQNKAIQAYFAAQRRFQNVLQEANAEINKILSGEPCSESDCAGCAHDCK